MSTNVNPPSSRPVSKIRTRRQALGLSQERVAREADCSLSTVRIAEHGYAVSDEMLGRLAKALECPAEDLRPEP